MQRKKEEGEMAELFGYPCFRLAVSMLTTKAGQAQLQLSELKDVHVECLAKIKQRENVVITTSSGPATKVIARTWQCLALKDGEGRVLAASGWPIRTRQGIVCVIGQEKDCDSLPQTLCDYYKVSDGSALPLSELQTCYELFKICTLNSGQLPLGAPGTVMSIDFEQARSTCPSTDSPLFVCAKSIFGSHTAARPVLGTAQPLLSDCIPVKVTLLVRLAASNEDDTSSFLDAKHPWEVAPTSSLLAHADDEASRRSYDSLLSLIRLSKEQGHLSDDVPGPVVRAAEEALRLFAKVPLGFGASGTSKPEVVNGLPSTLAIGTMVTRGPSWQDYYGMQDGKRGGKGRVVAGDTDMTGWVTILWENNGTENTYRYDLTAAQLEVVPIHASPAAIAAALDVKKGKSPDILSPGHTAERAQCGAGGTALASSAKASPLEAAALQKTAEAVNRFTSVAGVIDSLVPPAQAEEALHPSVRTLRATAVGPNGDMQNMRTYQRQALHWMLERELVYEINQGRKSKTARVTKARRGSLRAGSLSVGSPGPGGSSVRSSSLHGGSLSQGIDDDDDENGGNEGVDVPVVPLDHPLQRDARSGKTPCLDEAWMYRMRAAARQRYLPLMMAHGSQVGIAVSKKEEVVASDGAAGSQSATEPLLLDCGAEIKYSRLLSYGGAAVPASVTSVSLPPLHTVSLGQKLISTAVVPVVAAEHVQATSSERPGRPVRATLAGASGDAYSAPAQTRTWTVAKASAASSSSDSIGVIDLSFDIEMPPAPVVIKSNEKPQVAKALAKVAQAVQRVEVEDENMNIGSSAAKAMGAAANVDDGGEEEEYIEPKLKAKKAVMPAAVRPQRQRKMTQAYSPPGPKTKRKRGSKEDKEKDDESEEEEDQPLYRDHDSDSNDEGAKKRRKKKRRGVPGRSVAQELVPAEPEDDDGDDLEAQVSAAERAALASHMARLGVVLPSSHIGVGALEAPDPGSILLPEERPQHPEYSVPLPWLWDAPIVRAHGHPLWERIALEVDPGGRALHGNDKEKRKSRGKRTVAGDIGSAYHPCCKYYMNPALGCVIRERCTGCMKKALYDPPMAVEGRPRVETAPAHELTSGAGTGDRTSSSSTGLDSGPFVGFDGVARGGLLCDQMGLGKTLECIALIAVHPHSSQPFVLGNHPTGMHALADHIAHTSPTMLRDSLRELARLTTHASISFEVANDRASGRFDESRASAYSDFVGGDPYKQLTSTTNNSILESRATLVVVPSSIMGQWEAECRKWLPNLAVVVYPGMNQRNVFFCPHASAWRKLSECPSCTAIMFPENSRTMLPPAEDGDIADYMLSSGRAGDCTHCPHGKRITADSNGRMRLQYPCCTESALELERMRMTAVMSAADVVIASYDQLAQEPFTKGSNKSLLSRIFWHRVILDEVQMVEGKADAATSAAERKFISARTEAAMQLQASHRWAVSGTPLEAAEDVQAVLRFLRQQPFNDEALWDSVLAPALQIVPEAAALSSSSHFRLLCRTVSQLENVVKEDYNDFQMEELVDNCLKVVCFSPTVEQAVMSDPVLAPCVVKISRDSMASGRIAAWRRPFEPDKPYFLAKKEQWVHRIPWEYDPDDVRPPGMMPFIHALLGVLGGLWDDKHIVQRMQVAGLVAASKSSPLVRRLGSGLDLLASILRPIMWRNTQARVRATGQLTLPPVHEFVLSVRLSAGEQKVHEELIRQYRDGVVAQLKVALAGTGGAAATALYVAQAHAAAYGAAVQAAAQLQHGIFAAASVDIQSLQGVAKQALWDLRSVCAHLSASTRLVARLGLRSLTNSTGSSLHEVMRAFVEAAEDALQSAALEYAESAIRAGHAAVSAIKRLREVSPHLESLGIGIDMDSEEFDLNLFAEDADLKVELKERDLGDVLSMDDIKLARALHAGNVCPLCSKGRKGAHSPPCNDLMSLREPALLAHARLLLQGVPQIYQIASDALHFKVVPMDGSTVDGVGGSSSSSSSGSLTRDTWGQVVVDGDNGQPSAQGNDEPPALSSSSTAAQKAAAAKIAKAAAAEDKARDPVSRHKLMARDWSKALWAMRGMHQNLNRLEMAGVNVVDEEIEEVPEAKGRVNTRAAAGVIAELKGSGVDYAEFGSDRSALTILRASSKIMLERDRRMKATQELLPGKLSKLRYSLAAEKITRVLRSKWVTQAGAGAGAGPSSGSSSGMAVDVVVDDTDMQCLICLDTPESEGKAALTPCCHLFCTAHIAGWVLEKNGVPHVGALADEEVIAKLKPTMHAPCPRCKQSFRAGDLYTVNEKGMAEEVEAMSMATFLSRREAGRAAGAGSSAPSLTQTDLPDAMLSTAAVNAIPLVGTVDMTLKVGKSDKSSAELYGGKVACLVRRILSLPATDKVVIATSWPHVSPIVAAALRAEGVGSVVLEGSPGQMADAVTLFVHGTRRGEGDGAEMEEEDGIGNDAAATGRAKGSRKVPLPVRALVLSLGTDCAGLTLTAANHLFVLDPVLSPAVMAQLIGRICRQGQSRPCSVYHMTVTDSVEERMVVLRHRLAKGEGGAGRVGAEAVDAGARALVRQRGKVDDANSASTDRLSPPDLLYLLE